MKKVNKIRLNANENYKTLEENIITNLFSTIEKIELNRYPDTDGKELREAYAAYAGVKRENIILGNGSDEMLSLAISKNISKGEKIFALDPDFSMYDFYVSLKEGEVVKYKFNPKEELNIDNFISEGLKSKAKLIIFSNPNNPTGYGFKISHIKKILEAFKDKTVLVDEAYYEFYGESAIELINEYKNLIVTRTLSKAWGLAALRVGFLISNEESIRELMNYKVPYNVNSISQALAAKVIRNWKELKKRVEVIVKEREKLYKNLLEIQKESSLKIKFYPSKANYIFGETDHKDILIRALEEAGIIIRDFNKDNTFRITVASSLENEKVVEVIRRTFLK